MKQGNSEGGIQAEPNIKVGRYSVEERKDRIMRYLKKKNQRNFNKTIKVRNLYTLILVYLIIFLMIS